MTTAGARAHAYPGHAHLLLPDGPTTYTLSLSAAQVTSTCSFVPLSGSVSITKGVLTETARTGASTTRQVINLPQQPVPQAYSYHGALVVVGRVFPSAPRTVVALGINVEAPTQGLLIAVTRVGPGPG